jgi:hypothetical protein
MKNLTGLTTFLSKMSRTMSADGNLALILFFSALVTFEV